MSLDSDVVSTLLSTSLSLDVSELLNKVSLLLIDVLAACMRDEFFLFFYLSFTVSSLALTSSGSLNTLFPCRWEMFLSTFQA